MPRRILLSGAVAAFTAAFLLVVQFVIALGMGGDLALLSRSGDPARVTIFFQNQARALTLLMTADDGFAIAYAIAFIVLAFYIMPRSKLLAGLALSFALLTALFDLAENSLTIVLVEAVTFKQPVTTPALLLLLWLGQMKYLAIYLAAVLFAIGIWGHGSVGKIFAVFLLLFPLIGLAAISVEVLTLLQVLWMFVLLVTGGIFLWRAVGQEISSG